MTFADGYVRPPTNVDVGLKGVTGGESGVPTKRSPHETSGLGKWSWQIRSLDAMLSLIEIGLSVQRWSLAPWNSD
jgi:hypothetical protein